MLVALLVYAVFFLLAVQAVTGHEDKSPSHDMRSDRTNGADGAVSGRYARVDFVGSMRCAIG